jgi:pimeloyl-ACP methyl ester carboxylesterase
LLDFVLQHPSIQQLFYQKKRVVERKRGFGDTEKAPPGRNAASTAETFAEDLLALINALGFERIALVSGDVGAYASMAFVHKWPERLQGLFFLDHWSGDNPRVFAEDLEVWVEDLEVWVEDLEVWVDNFMRPGNIQGGFNWYVSSAATRLLSIEEKLPPIPKIKKNFKHLHKCIILTYHLIV